MLVNVCPGENATIVNGLSKHSPTPSGTKVVPAKFRFGLPT